MSVMRFFSEAGGEVIMLGSTVEPIMKKAEIIFHKEGAFLAEDLLFVIEKIQKTIDDLMLMEQAPKEQEGEDESEDEKQKRKDFVALRIRFFPLLELMEKALKKGKHVYWTTL